MKKLVFIALIMFSLFTLWAESSDTTVDEALLFPETDYTITLNPGIGFSMDFLMLFGLRANPALVFYGNPFGDVMSMFWVQADVQYATGYWFYDNTGNRIDPYGIDTSKAQWRQWNLFGNLIYRQGLIPGKDLQDLDMLTFVGMYSTRYYKKLESSSPDSFIFESDRPDAANDTVQNRFTVSLEFRKYETNKLYNTRRGTVADVVYEAVPLWLGNDFAGLSDFYRIGGDIRNYIPITQGRDFSMYIVEAFSYHTGWGDYIPISDAYGSWYACPVRGSFLYDATMHMSHNLELRMSFPNLNDFGMMPGFNLFYDCGIFDNYDHKFHKENFRHTLGLSYVMHMDSYMITPMSYQLDLQFGVVYDIYEQTPAFWFSFFFPTESQM